MIEVISVKKEKMSDYGKTALGVVYSAHVKVKDIRVRAEEMIEIISNTSWIERLESCEVATFKARSERTINKLVNDILSQVEDEISAQFGEYMISDTAQCILESELNHTKVPLAELLKEKVIGNPGFDFHTESDTNLIAFGEAKYSGDSNPHGSALSQIADFIELKKDNAELIIIKSFVSKTAVEKSLKGKKAYVAAFSINSPTPQKIIINALKSKAIEKLLNFPEVYIIGVEVDA